MLGSGWVGGTSPFARLNENAASVMSYDSCLLFLCHALAIRFLLRGEIPRRQASCEEVLAHLGGKFPRELPSPSPSSFLLGNAANGFSYVLSGLVGRRSVYRTGWIGA